MDKLKVAKIDFYKDRAEAKDVNTGKVFMYVNFTDDWSDNLGKCRERVVMVIDAVKALGYEFVDYDLLEIVRKVK
jgi:hypothetical protein